FAERAGFDPAEAEAALPWPLWVPVERVAEAGIEALEQGRATVVPGVANRLVAVGGRLPPRSLLVPAVARRHPGPRRCPPGSVARARDRSPGQAPAPAASARPRPRKASARARRFPGGAARRSDRGSRAPNGALQ